MAAPALKEAPIMVHAREVRPLRLRPGITGMQLLDVVKRRAGFGDGQVESASGAPLLHTDDAVPEGHYFFTPWPREKLSGASGIVTVRVRGGGVSPMRFPAGTTGNQLLRVLRGNPDFGDGTVDDLHGFCVPPSDARLAPGDYFFLPVAGQQGAVLLDIAATGTRGSSELPVVIRSGAAKLLWAF